MVPCRHQVVTIRDNALRCHMVLLNHNVFNKDVLLIDACIISIMALCIFYLSPQQQILNHCYRDNLPPKLY